MTIILMLSKNMHTYNHSLYLIRFCCRYKLEEHTVVHVRQRRSKYEIKLAVVLFSLLQPFEGMKSYHRWLHIFPQTKWNTAFKKKKKFWWKGSQNVDVTLDMTVETEYHEECVLNKDMIKFHTVFIANTFFHYVHNIIWYDRFNHINYTVDWEGRRRLYFLIRSEMLLLISLYIFFCLLWPYTFMYKCSVH